MNKNNKKKEEVAKKLYGHKSIPKLPPKKYGRKYNPDGTEIK